MNDLHYKHRTVSTFLLIAALTFHANAANPDSPCDKLRVEDQKQLEWITVPERAGADTIRILPPALDVKPEIANCADELIAGCRKGMVLPACKNIRQYGLTTDFIWLLEKEFSSCDFIRKSDDWMRHWKGTESGAHLCLHSVTLGGATACLTKYSRPIKIELNKKRLDMKGRMIHIDWISSYFHEFSKPPYHHLLGWMKSLPKPADEYVSNTLRGAIAIQERNADNLLAIYSNHHDMNTLLQSMSVDMILGWYRKLAPGKNICEEIIRLEGTAKLAEYAKSQLNNPGFDVSFHRDQEETMHKICKAENKIIHSTPAVQ